ncbi:von Willebrand factor type A domain protein [Caballeronia calidae]|uniref:von Willebrand factor type A domain protein n=1 Tax=Caballeronia calidae TaxID=1777139 RepID=A0A158DYX2_9BURK|nr:VWA domain-containing protein [Caballeronia calidae]SAK99778.1 von Willebrand factor type A domain protein [Caballeronia calidae]
MGFAKYLEDNHSRFYGSSIVRRREHDRFFTGGAQAPQENEGNKTTMNTSKLKDFTLAEARPLPVIVLADVSGSMSEDGKIEALNQALQDMIKAFAAEPRMRAEIQVGLITFGGSRADVHLPLAPAHRISSVETLRADGRTPMGAAFNEARLLIENRDLIPSRAYRPVLVLVSDGQPTDDWEPAFDALCRAERAQKATRFAMAIGADSDTNMLKRFANDVESPLFEAHEAHDIPRFFRAVTMSVTARSRSATPNAPLPLSLADMPGDDELDLDF